MKTYNKLVRDRIPEIIKRDGKKCSYREIDGYVFLKALDKKFLEEFKEFKKSRSIEELADIIEILYEYMIFFCFDDMEVESKRKEKFAKNGGFKNKIFLEDVD